MGQRDLQADRTPDAAAASRPVAPPVARRPGGPKILYVVPPSPAFAGVERVIHDVANAIMASPGNDLDVSVLYCADYAALHQQPIGYEPIHRPAQRLRHIPAVLRRLLRERRFDLVIVPQVEAATFAWAARPPRGTRMAIYLHGNPWIERGRSLQSGSLFMLFRLLAVRRYCGAFAVTPSLAREFREAYPSLAKSRWVPNPVRRFRESRENRTEGEGAVTFLNVGRLSYQKGQDILLDAFARVRAKRPGARLLIIGQGEMRPELEERIAKLGLTGAVEIGSMPTNPGPAFARADAFVSASRWEGWSLVIVEALSFGLPVIATDCDFGPRDILTDPRLGRLVANGDASALAEAMVAYCDQVDTAARHAPFREAYAARFRIENVIGTHIEAIRALIV